MICTWDGCLLSAIAPQSSSDGQTWANLCEQHAEKLKKEGIEAEPFDPRKMLSNWVKAQGGARKATQRMLG